jgi:hypothetical protein
MRRTLVVWFTAVGVFAAGCNGLLGNSDHEVSAADAAAEAATDSSAPVDSSSGYDGDAGSSSGADSAAEPDGRQDAGGPCTDVCTLGATQCSGNAVQSCVSGHAGCAVWGTAGACASGMCDAGQCGSGTCEAGQCAGDCDACTASSPSCSAGGPGMTMCGSGGASCCASLEVPGGTYDRSYDGLTYASTSFPATVSGFRLDAYEITVGRFRQYVDYLAGGGSLPTDGAGKHTHLNGGLGLSAAGGGYEAGWDAADWNGQVATTATGWNQNLSGGTWTAAPGTNENQPVTSIDWFEAYAFCIWDGGFLPSEAE